ncbi:MAG: ATP-binding cassette domain-containing protein [Pegethrix bostrychoides GSE-TBD4-15B]|jgi:ABC-type multidrug transport system ATPase subunit/ABC-type multidrug transport system permease subunit|uniref:ATP-binding cassette domain-containing protein n=1 Tax=Pegethrix bostrychoides GSE-TBD4-15B TaxID=2839662 RepID=A0A951U647_9CYAN|nr:ATP-binding cassette domain-containing protein [Pegethrix bostrychoides GSE-TBD4-15B]
MSNLSSQASTEIQQDPYLALGYRGQKLQFDLTQDLHYLGRDQQRCDLVIPDDWNIISSCHALLRRSGSDYRICDGDGQRPSTNGLFLDRTRITSTEGLLLTNGMQLWIGQNPQDQVQISYHNPTSTTTAVVQQQRILLRQSPITIGRDPSADLCLDAPIVSRKHAMLETAGQDYILHDYSTNGVFANGQRVNGSVLLTEGTTLNIGPFLLLLQGQALCILDPGNQIRLDADQLVREVQDQKGQPLRLLDQITLAIEPGQFVALVGGSGAGKSTLMRTLLGIDPTTSGQVYINGNRLRQNFNIYRSQIGYVPQDDIIHKELTVVEVLSYAAKLRLPPDTDVAFVVQQTLEQIEMTKRQNVQVSRLSGGQRKRVSIGVELLADPKLFFLDEPTSGLDPGLDKKMMQLLRKLADQGRTIILVTHATANITLCDRVVFLGRGGRLCFFGPPKEAPTFFNASSDDFADSFADIYNELEQDESIIQQWASRFQTTRFYQEYITNHLSLSGASGASSASRTPAQPPAQQVKPSAVQQCKLLTQRYFQLVQRDRVNLALALLTAPIGIGLITLAVRNKDPLVLGAEPDPTLAPLALRVLFVFTCAAIWVGLSGSLQEIVKEAAIYARERLVNLGISAYLSSKLLVLGGLALLQALLMLAIILIGFKSPQPDLLPWSLGVWITSFLTLLTSLSLGLMVSAIVKNGSQANSALPLLLLPQIIFSGVLFKIDGLAGKLSWLMLSRWSVGAYGALVNVNQLVPEPTRLPDGSILPQPFEPTPVYDLTAGNLALNWGMLGVHALVYWGITWWMQKRKDIF